MKYNYLQAVTDDVKEYIENEIDLNEWTGNRDGLEEQLNDDLWICDSVTGNASGSYYAKCGIRDGANYAADTKMEALVLSELSRRGYPHFNRRATA